MSTQTFTLQASQNEKERKDQTFLAWERNRHPGPGNGVLDRTNPKRPTPRYIIIKTAKVKVTILKAARGKQVAYMGNPLRLPTDSSAETVQGRREGQATLKVQKERNLQPRILCQARLSFRIEGERVAWTSKT